MDQPDHLTIFPLKVHVRQLFNFSKHLPAKLENAKEDDKERLSKLFK